MAAGAACADVLHSADLPEKSLSVLMEGSYRSPAALFRSAISVLQLLALSLLEAAPKLLSMVTCSTNSHPSLPRSVLSAATLGAGTVPALEVGCATGAFVCTLSTWALHHSPSCNPHLTLTPSVVFSQ